MELPDLDDLRSRYSMLTTEELLRLSKSGELTAEAQSVVDVELAHRSDRRDVETGRAIYEFAAAEVVRDVRGTELQERLVKEGLDSATAAMIARDTANAVMRAKRQAIKNRMNLGILALVIGILVTAFTREGAEATGGYYLVAWGAIFFGIVEVLRGGWALLKDR